jgi:predicted RNA-binding Zn ribbon-like protein
MVDRMVKYLALELASTIRHDGHGGVADDLTTVGELTTWVRRQADLFGGWADAFTADQVTWAEVVALRQAVRALFAEAVRPGPASAADAGRLLPIDHAVNRINTAAARAPLTSYLEWSSGGEPSAHLAAIGGDPAANLVASLARAGIDFLTGPQREYLRACTAPRCVRYFIQQHGRQEFCQPSCSNRARAARHYRRVVASAATPAG